MNKTTIRKLLLVIVCMSVFCLAACNGGGNGATTAPTTATSGATGTTSTETTGAAETTPDSSETGVAETTPDTSETASAETTPDSSETGEAEATPTPTPTPEPEPTPTETATRTLIVYFSWGGNTEALANEIKNQTGADIFEIVPTNQYTDDYDELLGIARNEQRNNARPTFTGSVSNIDAYDTIILGYPNWWSDMPMVVYTFLDTYDLSGKTIAPFVTSAGGGFANTINTIRSMESGATVTNGLSISGSAAANSANAVRTWLGNIGITG